MSQNAIPRSILAACIGVFLMAGCQTTPPPPLYLLQTALKNLQDQAVIRYELGEYKRALEIMARIEVLTKGTDDLLHLANAYNNMAAVHFELKEYGPAKRYLGLSLNLVVGLDDPDAPAVKAQALLNFASVHFALGSQTKAEESCAEAETLFRELKDEGGLIQVIRIRGRIQESLSAFERALEMYSEALDRSRSRGFFRLVSSVLADIGGVRETMGEYQKASVMYREALRIDKEHEQFIAVAKDLHVLGRLHEKRGELDLSAEYHARALNVYRIRIGHGPWIISQLRTLLRIARLRKDKEASAEYQRLLDAFKKPLPEKKGDGKS
jgi:tetratricopeptide (TPR) repeat protein